jgi:hypothetical protein
MAQRQAPMGAIAAFLVLLGLFGVGAGIAQLKGAPSLPALGLAHDSPPGQAGRPMARSNPTNISIPAIGVYAPVTPVGLATDGAVAAPPLEQNNLTGWYSGGPTPGQTGPAVIVGHVDGPRGESVFYRLGQLKPGQKVEVSLANHRVAVFSVYSVEYYPKGEFPGHKVYDDYSRPGLRLITCGGTYVGGSVGYRDNVVVYASLLARG